MAEVRISDVIVPPVFTANVINKTTELSRLWAAGVILPDAQITQLAQGPSSFFEMPYFNDLGDGEANIGSDDPTVKSVPSKIGMDKDAAQKHFRNKSWSSMDLTSALLNQDPMGVIESLVAGYWARQMQRTLIAALTGVIAANVAQDAGDMVVNVALPGTGTPAAANKIGAVVVLAAKQTLGDAAESLGAIAMHSAIYTSLQTQQLIAFIPNARGEVNIPTYLGYTVIVDDMCPVEIVSGNPVYTTYLFGRGAIGYGEGSPKVPTAVTRDETSGNGEGQEVLHNRKHFVLHPRGVKFTRATMTGASPTNAELALPANWDRVYTRKQIRFAAIKTNG
jgi:hypothetical protein